MQGDYAGVSLEGSTVKWTRTIGSRPDGVLADPGKILVGKSLSGTDLGIGRRIGW